MPKTFFLECPQDMSGIAVPIRMRLRRIAHVALASPSACPSLRSGLQNCFAIPQLCRAIVCLQCEQACEKALACSIAPSGTACRNAQLPACDDLCCAISSEKMNKCLEEK